MHVRITPDNQVYVHETISRPLKILRQKKYKQGITALFNCLKISRYTYFSVTLMENMQLSYYRGQQVYSYILRSLTCPFSQVFFCILKVHASKRELQSCG